MDFRAFFNGLSNASRDGILQRYLREHKEVSDELAELSNTRGYHHLLQILSFVSDKAVGAMRNADVNDTTTMAYCQAFSGVKELVEGIVKDLSLPEYVEDLLSANNAQNKNGILL